ncbi:hypothetical protein [Nocardioides marmotae]|uniref:Uncharacterized protein n=1 Tax=Nocardioides marmotae TaxID=2663857 RepID=A0A6I3IVU0_9ACTN|nr:hypothetical protein [Nocardioides marmotae]MCR6030906.1 hypothetical protein [Gordonia jinghuaiqii]MBC9731619.1 hypothetical protein [Nocardioides marmotae]MTB82741.1 hypothetical protein [Nocardioides marmotae]MTB94543.1 hypothetical protein [Nocardioides marmotae]QKE01442.1 hypothetical protein HPC71_10425 [Nocardioides marmotae]
MTRHTLRSLRRAWSGLRPLAPEEVLATSVGDLRASFVAPLGRVAPRGLALVGLRDWHGKRFRADDRGSVTGVNLVRRGGALEETMPMVVTLGVSLVDDLPALLVTYPPSTRKPWPWVRDELRGLPDGTVVGMTVVDLPGLRAAGGMPFLLTPG